VWSPVITCGLGRCPSSFVAAALQEDKYAKLIETSCAAHRRFLDSNVRHEIFREYTIFLAAAFVPMLILIFGVLGEIQALVALFLQRTIGPGGPLTGAHGPLIAAACLTIAVGLGPIAKFGPIIHEVFRPGQPSRTTENPPGEESHEHGTATGEPSPPEDSKPGIDQPHKRGQS
jgi:hypothetical protein